MDELTMSGDIADLMEALGRHDAAATLRWGQRKEVFADLVVRLETAEEQRDEREEEARELTVRLEDEQLKVATVKKILDDLPALIERLPDRLDDDAGGAYGRLLEAVDEARKAVAG